VHHHLLIAAIFWMLQFEDVNVVPWSLWPYDTLTFQYIMSQQNIKSLLILEDFRLANLFSRNASHSHDYLRRVSKSPLPYQFTCHRSGTLYWRVTRATSADSSRLIHTILAHPSTLQYHSTLCHHRTTILYYHHDTRDSH
jgi:hypothetical protein